MFFCNFLGGREAALAADLITAWKPLRGGWKLPRKLGTTLWHSFFMSLGTCASCFTKSHFEPVLPNFLRLGANVNIKMVSNTPAALPGKHSHQKLSMHHEPQHFPPSASLLDKVITQTQHLVGFVESFFFDVCLNTIDQQVTAHHEEQLRVGWAYDLPVKKHHKEELAAAHDMAMRRWKRNLTPNCGWTMEELVGAHGSQPELVLLFVGKQEIGKQGFPTLATPHMSSRRQDRMSQHTAVFSVVPGSRKSFVNGKHPDSWVDIQKPFDHGSRSDRHL